jgi:hypothetical protein
VAKHGRVYRDDLSAAPALASEMDVPSLTRASQGDRSLAPLSADPVPREAI